MEDVVRLASLFIPCSAIHDVNFVGRDNSGRVGCQVLHPGAHELEFFAAIATEESGRQPCIVQAGQSPDTRGYGLWQITGCTQVCDLTQSCCNARYMKGKRDAFPNDPYSPWEDSHPNCENFEAAWSSAVQAYGAVCGVGPDGCTSDQRASCAQFGCGCKSGACASCPVPVGAWLPATLSVLQ